MTENLNQFKGTEPTNLGEESKSGTFTVPKDYFMYSLYHSTLSK